MALEVGSTAPDFAQKNQHGAIVRLSDLRGQKIALYFYPKDNTPGCTAQACNLNDNLAVLQQAGYKVIGVSTDSTQSHQKFIRKFDLQFDLLADEDHQVVEAYQVWVAKQMYGRSYMGTARTTFLINEQGIIERIISKVDTKNHAEQILSSL